MPRRGIGYFNLIRGGWVCIYKKPVDWIFGMNDTHKTATGITGSLMFLPFRSRGSVAHSTGAGFKVNHRRFIRKLELEHALSFFGSGKRVLEIGAGAGWQANLLARKGYDVTAIDIPESNYSALREYNVIMYDGIHIPAPDQSFDVIFSSNVLEHVSHLEDLQREMFRVLKPGGTAVHIMPTPTWRFWTICSFYLRRLIQLGARLWQPRTSEIREYLAPKHGDSFAGKLRRALLPARHGSRGSWISELYLFSEFRWRNALKNDNWHLHSVVPNRIFYTGFRLLGEKLSIGARRNLSAILGSSCKVYVLKRSLVEGCEAPGGDHRHTGRRHLS